MDDIASQDVPLPSPFNIDVFNLSIGVLPSVQDSSAEVSRLTQLPRMSLHGSRPCRYTKRAHHPSVQLHLHMYLGTCCVDEYLRRVVQLKMQFLSAVYRNTSKQRSDSEAL